MSEASQNYQLIDSIEDNQDITDQSYEGYRIKRIDVYNSGTGDIILTLPSIGVITIGQSESWGYFVDVKSFSLTASGNSYSIQIGV